MGYFVHKLFGETATKPSGSVFTRDGSQNALTVGDVIHYHARKSDNTVKILHKKCAGRVSYNDTGQIHLLMWKETC